MNKIALFVLVWVMVALAGYHKDSRDTDVHTPFRWIVADAAALQALVVTTGDTGKMAFQRSDTSIWLLIDNSPKLWTNVRGASVFPGTFKPDSIAATRGISGTIGRFTTSIISAIGTFTGAVTVDSLKSTKGISATTGTFSGVVGADSLRSTKGVSGTIGRFTTSIISAIGTFTGAVTVDSLKSTKGINATTGTFSGVVGADSLRSTKGVSGTIGRFTTSIISAIGTFTGTVTVDSLKSTKGINATTGTFSGVVGADSLRSTKGVSGTIGRFTTSTISAIGTFTGTVTVDSLKSTKGINATTGTFSGKVNGASIGDDVVNYSSSSTLTGFASTTNKSVYYLKTGKLVTVWFSIWGVSDDATATFTIPLTPAITPTGYARCQLGTTVESGYLECTAGTVFVQRYAATWPTTGNKLIDGHFSFFVN